MEPFRIGEWWLIVRLEQYLPGKFDKAMSAQMSNELFEDWINEELATIVTQTVNLLAGPEVADDNVFEGNTQNIMSDGALEIPDATIETPELPDFN